MNILDYYIERSKDSSWVEKFQSTSDRNEGKVFQFTNTNFRTIGSYKTIFNKFINYVGIDRKDWDKNIKTGQEVAKQHVVRMRQSKLFKSKKSLYLLTHKGESFRNMLEMQFSKNEEWLLIYFYLLNSYFNLTPLYIKKRVDSLFNLFQEQDYSSSELILTFEKYLLTRIKNNNDLFSEDIFWLITFHKDPDFISIFKNSTIEEKNKLKFYVQDKQESKNYEDLIVKKYKENGQFTINTFNDELKIIYFTKLIIDSKAKELKSLSDLLITKYKEFNPVNYSRLIDFISSEEDIFEIILNEFNGNIEEDILSLDYEFHKEKEPMQLSEDKIDDTSTKNIREIAKVSSVLKRMAKERNSYRCELEILNECKYFTSRENDKNYLEVHHLIPREFSNEYEDSIEVIDNYVALCPHCHRLIHFGKDRERFSAIKYLHSLRAGDLFSKGLDAPIEVLKVFYDISL